MRADIAQSTRDAQTRRPAKIADDVALAVRCRCGHLRGEHEDTNDGPGTPVRVGSHDGWCDGLNNPVHCHCEGFAVASAPDDLLPAAARSRNDGRPDLRIESHLATRGSNLAYTPPWWGARTPPTRRLEPDSRRYPMSSATDPNGGDPS